MAKLLPVDRCLGRGIIINPHVLQQTVKDVTMSEAFYIITTLTFL